MQKHKIKTANDDQSRRLKEEENIHIYNNEYELQEEEIGGSNYGEDEEIPKNFAHIKQKKVTPTKGTDPSTDPPTVRTLDGRESFGRLGSNLDSSANRATRATLARQARHRAAAVAQAGRNVAGRPGWRGRRQGRSTRPVAPIRDPQGGPEAV